MGLHKLKVTVQKACASAWIVPAGMVLIAFLIMLAGDPGREYLRYERVWTARGEGWRLLSGHFTHLGWSHFALNSAGLLLIWYLVGRAYALRSWLLIILVTLATIDMGFWFLNPELYWYVGLSGLLHGLLVAGIATRFQPPNAETIILALFLVAKLGWEQFGGPVPGSEITSGGPVVVDAHLYGALGGVLGALLIRIRVRPPASI